MTGSICIKAVSPLDWPTETSLSSVKIQCIGESYSTYRLRRDGQLPFLPSHLREHTTDNSKVTPDAESLTNVDGTKKKKPLNLLTMKEEKLNVLSYYKILEIPMHAIPDSIRKAYHKACLKYHPDKTGRGEEDYVFLKIKEAFDTLSDTVKRRSYDSSVDFDDAIPKEGPLPPKKFFKTYQPVFERNLRFAVHKTASDENGHSNVNGDATKKKGKKKKKNNSNSSSNGGEKSPKKIEPPKLGDMDTPIEEVNKFYDYWTRFESWRDFTLKASKETDHDVDAAECREEKRWMAKEIERKAKLMKKQEVARIATLVQRAMATDPRLKAEKERIQAAKKRREDEKRSMEEEAQKKKEVEEERLRLEKENNDKKDKEQKAQAKQSKEKEKKALRKAKQTFRKYTMALFQDYQDEDACWTSLDEMNDEVELLCSNLSLSEILSLNSLLDGGDSAVNIAALPQLRDAAEETNQSLSAEKQIKIKKRDKARALDQKKREEVKVANAMKPWSKEELSALAKGVKKYPPGGANRWETIALFINNLLKQETPRTKEECIEAYNVLASNAGDKLASIVAPSTPAPSCATENGSSNNTSDWSDEQDKKLQEGLSKFPASMDKNARWTSIAKCVEGKTKKECVARYKSIRESIKNKSG